VFRTRTSLVPSHRKVHQPSVIFSPALPIGYSPIAIPVRVSQRWISFKIRWSLCANAGGSSPLCLPRERWWLVAIVSSAVAIAAVSLRLSESEAAREKRIHEAKKKELRALADRISKYAKSLRERFPDGAVVVSEEDLAAQLRKRPDYIATALNVLLKEEKVQRMPLTGYWKLNA
jgi:hypothetical protein